MEKVLLLDTNVSSYPIYQFLAQSGYEVFVVGNNASDFLAKSVNNFINIDYSNVDAVLEIIDSYKINYIIPGCNDHSYAIASKINEIRPFFGIETPSTTDLINNKGKFRELARQINLPVPRVFSVREEIQGHTVIVKPVDAYSGRGVTIVSSNDPTALRDAVSKAEAFSRSGNVVIEEYVQGQLYSHTAFIADGKILIDFIVEEHGTANPFVVDTSRLEYTFPLPLLMMIRDAITRLVVHLDSKDGLMHTQFIVQNDSIWIIEVTRRCPGDLYSKLIEHATDFPYARFYTMPFLSQKMVLPPEPLAKKRVFRHTVSEREECLFTTLKFRRALQLEEMVPLTLAGTKIKASPFDRVALIFVKCENDNEFAELWNLTLNRQLYFL